MDRWSWHKLTDLIQIKLKFFLIICNLNPLLTTNWIKLDHFPPEDCSFLSHFSFLSRFLSFSTRRLLLPVTFLLQSQVGNILLLIATGGTYCYQRKRIVTRGNILLRGNVWLLEEIYCYQREKNITSEMIGRISRKNSQSGNFSLYMLGGIAFSLTTRKAEFEK